MKYWRGYLTAGILGVFAWLLMQFGKTHTELVDMFYPYVTRLIQGSLAQWSGGTEELLWQLVLVMLAVVVLATVVLMIILKWNPIQWLGWVLAVVSVFLLLNVGVYGLNDYAGPLAEDIKLEMTDYTLDQLQEATKYFQKRANALAEVVKRDNQGDPLVPSFEESVELANGGYLELTYTHHIPIFYGTAMVTDEVNWTQWKSLPIKKLGWTDYYTSVGTLLIHTPMTGEIAVNPNTPGIALPFVMCKGMANRLSIANDGDAEFAAFMACTASSSRAFQYSGFFMAYRSCKEALASMPGDQAKQALAALNAGENDDLTKDLERYEQFFVENRDEEAMARLETIRNFWDDLSYNVRDFLEIEKLSVETDAFYDILVNWHLQEIVLPTVIPEEEENPFDPYYEDYINGLVDLNGDPIEPPTEPEETTGSTEEE